MRKAAKITIPELEKLIHERILNILPNVSDINEENINNIFSLKHVIANEHYDNDLIYFTMDYLANYMDDGLGDIFGKKLAKDISKVDFDFENCTSNPNGEWGRRYSWIC